MGSIFDDPIGIVVIAIVGVVLCLVAIGVYWEIEEVIEAKKARSPTQVCNNIEIEVNPEGWFEVTNHNKFDIYLVMDFVMRNGEVRRGESSSNSYNYLDTRSVSAWDVYTDDFIKVSELRIVELRTNDREYRCDKPIYPRDLKITTE